MKENLKIGIITDIDPDNKRSWSGIYYKMSQALKNEFSNVIHLGPVKLSIFKKLFMYGSIVSNMIFQKLIFGKRFDKVHNKIKCKLHSEYFDKQLENNNVDVIFAPTASTQIACLKSNTPICYYSDSTFIKINDYYEIYTNLSRSSIKISNEIEQKAINKSLTQVFASEWAYKSAINDYNAQNPYIAKMGANIDKDPADEEIIKQYNSSIEILFVGVDWKRKGGDIALETVEKLVDKGFDIHFTVCGCVPPGSHPNMTVIPFLDKNKEDDMKKFNNLYKKSHLFFLPTRAECYGIVFCEANAFGMPAITTDTGGVSSVVENGVNGYLLPEDAKSDEYTQLIESLLNDKNKLKNLAISSRKKYLNELNWKVWGKQMKEIIIKTYQMSNENNS